MNQHFNRLYQLSQSSHRNIIGLMSGTSLDGLDIAYCRITGFGSDTAVEIVAFQSIDYDKNFVSQIREVFSQQQVDLKQLTRLNKHIGTVHGKMVNEFLKQHQINPSEIDGIASHGQTIFHAPLNTNESSTENVGHSTLQIGDADQIAAITGIIAFSDFRQKHIAFGGEGAPLATYGDYLLFKSANFNRCLVNIGGISNLTYIASGKQFKDVVSTDIGPGNTLLDAVVRQYTHDKTIDHNGDIAASGRVNSALLSTMKQDAFFQQPFPKSTGPELFNWAWLQEKLRQLPLQNGSSIAFEDILCSLCQLSADTIYQAIEDSVKRVSNEKAVTEVFISGGGIHNKTLMNMLSSHIDTSELQLKTGSFDQFGIHPDAKEAVLFALLANQTISGDLSVWGKGGVNTPAVNMGKISLPE